MRNKGIYFLSIFRRYISSVEFGGSLRQRFRNLLASDWYWVDSGIFSREH